MPRAEGTQTVADSARLDSWMATYDQLRKRNPADLTAEDLEALADAAWLTCHIDLRRVQPISAVGVRARAWEITGRPYVTLRTAVWKTTRCVALWSWSAACFVARSSSAKRSRRMSRRERYAVSAAQASPISPSRLCCGSRIASPVSRSNIKTPVNPNGT
jgi:hypothetical protein